MMRSCTILPLVLTQAALGALNLDQAIEEAVLQLRERVYIVDGLVASLPQGICDSALDGPHCAHAGIASTNFGGISSSALLADGVFSARLFGSEGSGEMLDETLLRPATGKDTSEVPPSSATSRVPRRGRRRSEVGRGRSALLSFRGLEPWRTVMPLDFAGTQFFGSGFPFAIHWVGPWDLITNPLKDTRVVRPGRFVAELRGAVGSIHFGRKVHLQAIDLARPARRDCLESQGVRQHGKETHLVSPPLVVKGRRQGVDVFVEVVPHWEITGFVNGVAFTALTSLEAVDEVVFIGADCLLVGAVQATFGSDSPVSVPSSTGASAGGQSGTLLMTMRGGWRAFGWEEIEFRASNGIGNAPAWNMNEVVRERLGIRHGVFEEPRRISLEEMLAEDELPPGIGPEPIGMALGFEEVQEAGPSHVDPLDTVMDQTRNASMVASLLAALEMDAALAVAELRKAKLAADEHFKSLPSDAALLRGLKRSDVNADLARLLEALVQIAEAGDSAVAGYANADAVFDAVWRRSGLHFLDSLLIRWRAIEVNMIAHRSSKTSGSGPMSQKPVQSSSSSQAAAGETLADGSLRAAAVAAGHAAAESAAEAAVFAPAAAETGPHIHGSVQEPVPEAELDAVDGTDALGSADGRSFQNQSFEHVTGVNEAMTMIAAAVAAVVPGANVTQQLAAALVLADEAIRLRILIKRHRVTGSQPAGASRIIKGIAGGAYTVRIEPSTTGVSVSVISAGGREATSMLPMKESDANFLMESLDRGDGDENAPSL